MAQGCTVALGCTVAPWGVPWPSRGLSWPSRGVPWPLYEEYVLEPMIMIYLHRFWIYTLRHQNNSSAQAATCGCELQTLMV